MSFLLSAQRVAGSRGEGINVSLYRREGDIPRNAGGVDVTRAFAFDGALVAHRHDVPPGGNNVRSYVDVALSGPDEALLDGVLGRALESLDEKSPPLQVRTADAALELNMEIGLHHVARDELRELIARARPLLSRAAELPGTRTPLKVLVHASPTSARFVVDDESQARLRAIDPTWAPSPITVERTVGDDFELLAGPLLPHIALIATRMDVADLVDLGGVVFVDAATGRSVGSWSVLEGGG